MEQGIGNLDKDKALLFIKEKVNKEIINVKSDEIYLNIILEMLDNKNYYETSPFCYNCGSENVSWDTNICIGCNSIGDEIYQEYAFECLDCGNKDQNNHCIDNYNTDILMIIGEWKNKRGTIDNQSENCIYIVYQILGGVFPENEINIDDILF